MEYINFPTHCFGLCLLLQDLHGLAFLAGFQSLGTTDIVLPEVACSAEQRGSEYHSNNIHITEPVFVLEGFSPGAASP